MKALLKINNRRQIDEIFEVEIIDNNKLKLYTASELMDIIVDLDNIGPIAILRLLDELYLRDKIDLTSYDAHYDEDEDDEEQECETSETIAAHTFLDCPKCHASLLISADRKTDFVCPECYHTIHVIN